MSNCVIIAAGGAGNPTPSEMDDLINGPELTFPHADLKEGSARQFPSNPAFEPPSSQLPSFEDILAAQKAESIKNQQKYEPLFAQAAEKGLKVAILEEPSILAIVNAPPVVRMVCFDKDGNEVSAPANMQAEFDKIQQQETPQAPTAKIAEEPNFKLPPQSNNRGGLDGVHIFDDSYQSPYQLSAVRGAPTMDFYTAVTGDGFSAAPVGSYKPASNWVAIEGNGNDTSRQFEPLVVPKLT